MRTSVAMPGTSTGAVGAVGPIRRDRWRARIAASLLLGLALVATLGADAGASSVITHGSRERRWVALTFDDGWSATNCARIAGTLRAKGAMATFLVNGVNVARDPSRWRGILAGFPVANHTRTHAWLTRLGAAGIRSEIVSNERIIESAIGRPMLHLLRPPYGAYDSQVVSVADALGYRTVLWDTSGVDTSSASTTASVIRNATRGGPGSIVLMHCGPAATPGAVGPIIDAYRARGYQLVGLDQMLGGGGGPVIPRHPKACRVRDLDGGKRSSSLQRAANAASDGDRLTVQGTCRGTTVLRKDLRITGTRTAFSGPPTLDGKGDGSVLTVRGAAVVRLKELIIRGGAHTDRGGGIDNKGTLGLRSVTVRGNKTRGTGGGVFNGPGATLRLLGDSAVRGNAAGERGGGIANEGSLFVSDSAAISGNEAGSTGGGLDNAVGATAKLGGDSAVRSNRADQGAGVANAGTLEMRASSAIAHNTATTAGGGVLDEGGTLVGVVCGPGAGANVRGNSPDQCATGP